MALGRHIRFVLATWLLFAVAGTLTAQQAEAGLYPKTPHDSPSLPLEMLDVRCDILGNWAVTSWELRFRGGGDADFHFPLPPEVILSSVEVAMRSQGGGQRKLPGPWEVSDHLLPKSQLPAGKPPSRKTIHNSLLKAYGQSILHLGALNTEGKDVRILLITKQQLATQQDEYTLGLPLQVDQPADSFQLQVVAHQQYYKPTAKSRALKSLRFKRQNGNYKAVARRLDHVPRDFLTVKLPISYGVQTAWYGEGEDSIPFALHLPFESSRTFSKPPRRIGIAWDASLAGGDRDTELDFNLLKRMLDPLREVEVEVLLFDRKVRASRIFQVRNGNWGDLKAYLKEASGDGDRSFEVLAEHWPTCDLLLVFTAHPELSSDVPQLPPNSFLIYQGAPSGIQTAKAWGLQPGQVIDQGRSGLRDAFDQVRVLAPEIIRLKAKAKHIAQLSAQNGDEAHGGTLITGTLTSPSAQMSVLFGHGGKPAEKVKVKLAPPGTEAHLYHLIEALSAPNLALPRIFPKGLNDQRAHGQAMPAAWSPWLRALEAWEQAEQEAQMLKQAEQYAWNKELYTEDWQAMRSDWAGNFDPAAKLPEPTLATEDADLPATAPVQPPPLSLQLLQIPSLVLAGDTVYTNGLPNRLHQDVVAVEWLRGGALTAWFGPTASNGILWARLKGGPDSPTAYLGVPEWQEAAPYMKNQFGLPSRDYDTYLLHLPKWRSHPSFFLDWADQFIVQGQRDLAVRCLSNFAATGQEEPEVLRAAAHRLLAWDARELAVRYFERVADLLPGDVTAMRDLGLALERAGKYREAQTALSTALALDGEMLDARFPGIRKILLREFNHLCSMQGFGADSSLLPSDFPATMPLDLRITCDWNRSDTDVDLIVTGPDSVTCDYDQPVTPGGGMVAGDVTDGFGPEEFVQRNAMRGVYKIEVEYEDNPERRISGPTFVLVTIYTDYGGREEQIKTIPLRLSGKSGKVEAARVSVE